MSKIQKRTGKQAGQLIVAAFEHDMTTILMAKQKALELSEILYVYWHHLQDAQPGDTEKRVNEELANSDFIVDMADALNGFVVKLDKLQGIKPKEEE